MVQRFYDALLESRLAEGRIALVSGPKEVGKTTTCVALAADVLRLSWAEPADRQRITAGVGAMTEHLGAVAGERTVVFDELQRYRRWKPLLAGLHDRYGRRLRIVVRANAELGFSGAGDLLQGRCALVHMHPLSEGELLRPTVPPTLIAEPRRLPHAQFSALWSFGGFPEPFTRAERRFHARWQTLRTEQLVRVDLRDLTQIQELDQLELLVQALQQCSAKQISCSALARKIDVSWDTTRRWLEILTSHQYAFAVRPWFRNVKRSLRKEPKYYLRDWSRIDDPAARAETYLACHLYKAVQTWQDSELGTFELRYVRDKTKRGVDFVVVRDDQPWFLVQLEPPDAPLNPALGYFQKQVGAHHAFQVVMDLPFADADPFTRHEPAVVAARTLLSQLP